MTQYSARTSTRNTPHKAAGFTLIEVLVALAIVAVALMTGMKVSGALVFNAHNVKATCCWPKFVPTTP
jgi:prepilin-type N-terminal cleavage/methylation domain-containing protein